MPNTPKPANVMNNGSRRRLKNACRDDVDDMIDQVIPKDIKPASRLKVTKQARQFLQRRVQEWTDNQVVISTCSQCGRVGQVSGKSRVCVGRAHTDGSLFGVARSDKCQEIALLRIAKIRRRADADRAKGFVPKDSSTTITGDLI